MDSLTSIQLSYADSINIVSEESNAEIVIGSGATPTEKYAAAELNDRKRASGHSIESKP